MVDMFDIWDKAPPPVSQTPVASSAPKDMFDVWDKGQPQAQQGTVGYDRGILGDIGSHLARGAVQAVGAVGRGMQMYDADPEQDTGIIGRAGRMIADLADTAPKKYDFLKPDVAEAGEGLVRRGLSGAAESIPQSAIPFATGWAGAKTGALIGSAVAPGPGTAIGAVAGGIIGGTAGLFHTFFLGTYQQEFDASMKESERRGLPKEEAAKVSTKHAWTSAAYEAGTELASDAASALFFGLIGKQAIKQGLKQTIKQVVSGPAFLKAAAKTVPFETGSEMVAAYGQTKSAREVGLTDMTEADAMKEAVLPSVFMSLFLGAGIRGMQRYEAHNLYNDLNGVSAQKRADAAMRIAGRLDKEDRRVWLDTAKKYIETGQAIPISQQITDFAAQKAYSEETGTPPPTVESAAQAEQPVEPILPGQPLLSPEELQAEQSQGLRRDQPTGPPPRQQAPSPADIYAFASRMASGQRMEDPESWAGLARQRGLTAENVYPRGTKVAGQPARPLVITKKELEEINAKTLRSDQGPVDEGRDEQGQGGREGGADIQLEAEAGREAGRGAQEEVAPPEPEAPTAQGAPAPVLDTAEGDGAGAGKDVESQIKSGVFRAYRNDTVPPDANKPHGAFFNIDQPGFESRHAKDIKGADYRYDVKPKNPLLIKEDEKEEFAHIGDDANVRALAALRGEDHLNELKILGGIGRGIDDIRGTRAGKEKLKQRFSKEYPEVDWGKYYDSREMVMAVGGIEARRAGHDAVVLYGGMDPLDAELVVLDGVLLQPNARPVASQKPAKPQPALSGADEAQADLPGAGTVTSPSDEEGTAKTEAPVEPAGEVDESAKRESARRDRAFEKMIAMKAAEDKGDGIYFFTENFMTPQRRRSLMSESEAARGLLGRITQTERFEFKPWAEVTGDVGANGYAILDRKDRIASRTKPAPEQPASGGKPVKVTQNPPGESAATPPSVSTTGAGPVQERPAPASKVEITGPADDKTVSVDMPKARADALPPKEQKRYLLAEIDKAIEQAPSDPEGLEDVRGKATGLMKSEENTGENWDDISKLHSEFGTVTIEVPRDGEFTILNEKSALQEFKKKASSFPVSSLAKKAYGVPSKEPTGRRITGFYGEYKKDYVPLKSGVVEAEDGENLYVDGFFSDRSYAVLVAKKPATKKGYADRKPDIKAVLKGKISKAKIKREQYVNASEDGKADVPVIVVVEDMDGNEYGFNALYFDSILTEYPNAKVYLGDDGKKAIFVDGGKRVGVVMYIKDAVKKVSQEQEAADTPKFSFRTTPDAEHRAASTVSAVERTVTELTRPWANAPEWKVVQSQAELPDGIKRHMKTGDVVDGVFFDGKIYLVADNLKGDAVVINALLHESFGHYGLRQLLGKEGAGPLLNQIWLAKNKEARAIAAEPAYKIDTAKLEGRQLAAEEWLAREAQNNPESTWVDKAVRLVREWIRKLGIDLKLTDGEIRAWLSDMRKVVVEGATEGQAKTVMRYRDARFMFAGPKAKGAARLDDAKRMKESGASRDDVWRETGWWQLGDDWKFEIDDRNIKAKGSLGIGDRKRIGDVVSFPELERMYPEIFDTVYVTDNGTGNSYTRETKTLTTYIKPKAQIEKQLKKTKESLAADPARDDLKQAVARSEKMLASSTGDFVFVDISSLAHEIMHAIQEHEGFARGGNRAFAKTLPEYQQDLKEAEDFERETGAWTAPEWKTYQRLTGEAESRLVQRRLDMTAEQRKAEPPWVTLEKMLREEGLLKEGQRPEDVLISRKGSGVSESRSEFEIHNPKKREDSFYSDDFGKRGGFRVNGKNDNAWAIFDENGAFIKKGEGSLDPGDRLKEWTQAVTRAVNSPLNSLPNNIFIRLGDMPKGGKSTDWSSGKKEKGISVYGAKKDLLTDTVWFSGQGETGAASLSFAQGRKVYLVTGNKVGIGKDGEPVIKNAKIISELELHPDESVSGFVMVSEEGADRSSEFKPVDVNSKEFKRWFSGSKVVDENGKPLRVYHGTPLENYAGKKIEAFSVFRTEDGNFYPDEVGSFFTDNAASASDYAYDGVVYTTYLSIKNPYIVTNKQWQNSEGLSPIEAKAAGHDGYIIKMLQHSTSAPDADTYIAFYPTQIKSAISNTGAFSDTDPDIRFSAKTGGSPYDLSFYGGRENQPKTVQEVRSYVEQAISKREGRKLPEGSVKVVGATTPEQKVVNDVARYFGYTPVFLNTGKIDIGFNGFALDTMPRHIFLTDKTVDGQSLLSVAGHELLHKMKKSDPDLYEFLAGNVLPLGENLGPAMEKIASDYERANIKIESTDALLEEFMAEFVGDQFARKDFWNRLYEKSPSMAQKILDAVKKILDKVAAIVTRRINFKKHFPKLHEARDVLVDTMAEFKKRQAARKGPTGSGIAFSARSFAETQAPLTPSDYDTVFETRPDMKKKAVQQFLAVKREVGLLFDKYFGATHTRLANIDKRLAETVRMRDERILMNHMKRVQAVEQLLRKAKGMSKRDRSDWDYARLCGNTEKLNELKKRYGLTDEYASYRKMLDSTWKEAVEAGLDPGFIEEYAPRSIKDPRGFLLAISDGKYGDWGLYTQKMKERAAELNMTFEEMTDDLRAEVVSNLILSGSVGIGTPSNLKQRKLEKIPADLMQYYMDPDAALMAYIYNMTKAIETRRFFGKIPKNAAKMRDKLRSVQTQIREINANLNGNRTDKQERNLARLKAMKPTGKRKEAVEKQIKRLEAISGTMPDEVADAMRKRKNRLIGAEKETKAYLTRIGKFDVKNEAATGIIELMKTRRLSREDERVVNDILTALFHEHGTTGVFSSWKNLSLIDTMGSFTAAITQIGDLAWPYYIGGPAIASKNLAKAVAGKSRIKKEDLGLSYMAEEFADSTTMAKAVAKVFKLVGLEKIDSIGKETLVNTAYDVYRKDALKDPEKLRTKIVDTFGDETDNVIADLQKDVISENVKMLVLGRLLDFQPVALSEMPQGYLMAGNGRIFYMLKTFTLKQFDIFRRECYNEIKKGDAESVIRGVKNLVSLSMLFVLANAGADFLKDRFLDRKTDMEDRVADNLLRLAGVSKFITWKARTEGVGSAMLKQILPPVKFIDSFGKDVYNAGDDKGLEMTASIPVIGKLYYWHWGRGASKYGDAWDRRWSKAKSRYREVHEGLDRAEDKDAYRKEYREELIGYRKVNNIQGELNKRRRIVNRLRAKEQTPEITERIKRLEEARTDLIKKYLKEK